MEGVKIYGLCLGRLRHQVTNAQRRIGTDTDHYPDRVLLEGYNTSDVDEIIDILELYDIEDRTPEHVRMKLEELADTVSVLIRETVEFDFTQDGEWGLYLSFIGRRAELSERAA